MRKTILLIAIIVASGILFVNVYTSIVDARNWGSDIPNSLNAARAYFSVANPGTFFRVFSPANQLIAVLALILCWRAGSRVRIYLGLALLLGISTDLFTFAYFYPRNDIMFVAPLTDNAALRAAWEGWSTMNWLRSAMIAVQVVLDCLALNLVINPGRRLFR